MIEILQKEHPVLRARARTITQEEIGTAPITEVIRLMKEALATQADGVAIAAPQIGLH
jgi:peptide deformylase